MISIVALNEVVPYCRDEQVSRVAKNTCGLSSPTIDIRIYGGRHFKLGSPNMSFLPAVLRFMLNSVRLKAQILIFSPVELGTFKTPERKTVAQLMLAILTPR